MTAEELVRESCAAQGVPEYVEDARVLAMVASRIRASEEAEQRAS